MTSTPFHAASAAPGIPPVAQLPAEASILLRVSADAEAAGGELIPAPPLGNASTVLVSYLRTKRQIRGRGRVVGCYPNGSLRIQPVRTGWKQVIVTPQEITAASKS